MSLDLDSLRAFVRVAELGSFTRAAAQLGAPKARVSHQVQRLEEQLGSQLLQRTTRQVRVTRDGEQLIARAKALLAEADALEGLFLAASSVRGRVRIDMTLSMARDLVIPKLGELRRLHPELEIVLSTADRRVDVVGEGFDCVVRVGALGDSELVAVRVGQAELINCASPDYLERHGRPRTPLDLEQHWVVHYSGSLGSDAAEFEWEELGKTRTVPMRAALTVNSTDALRAACVAGLGIAQMPGSGVRALLESGKLEEVLPNARCAPMPISLLHAHGRRVPRRVRVVMDWLLVTLAPVWSAPWSPVKTRA
jgi:DNA-binding transcriptional LysR family regulator